VDEDTGQLPPLQVGRHIHRFSAPAGAVTAWQSWVCLCLLALGLPSRAVGSHATPAAPALALRLLRCPSPTQQPWPPSLRWASPTRCAETRCCGGATASSPPSTGWSATPRTRRRPSPSGAARAAPFLLHAACVAKAGEGRLGNSALHASSPPAALHACSEAQLASLYGRSTAPQQSAASEQALATLQEMGFDRQQASPTALIGGCQCPERHGTENGLRWDCAPFLAAQIMLPWLHPDFTLLDLKPAPFPASSTPPRRLSARCRFVTVWLNPPSSGC
jgi:hypothetical protein